jgi:hypothetical protein
MILWHSDVRGSGKVRPNCSRTTNKAGQSYLEVQDRLTRMSHLHVRIMSVEQLNYETKYPSVKVIASYGKGSSETKALRKADTVTVIQDFSFSVEKVRIFSRQSNAKQTKKRILNEFFYYCFLAGLGLPNP